MLKEGLVGAGRGADECVLVRNQEPITVWNNAAACLIRLGTLQVGSCAEEGLVVAF